MSDEIMLQGVLRMPIDCWSNDIISVTQRHGRYIQAADKIESLEKRLKELDDRLLDKQNANKALFSIYDESEVENNLLKDKVKELNNDLDDRQKGFEDILRCYDMPNKVISTCKKFVG